MSRTLKVTYDLKIEPEDIPFEGNCSAVDPETDKQQEEWIRSELARGNDYAWCVVIVEASVEYEGRRYEGGSSCGGCSYRDRAELEEHMVPDLKREALADLRARLSTQIANVNRDAEEIRKRADKARATLARLPKRVR